MPANLQLAHVRLTIGRRSNIPQRKRDHEYHRQDRILERSLSGFFRAERRALAATDGETAATAYPKLTRAKSGLSQK
jgi:hypothetical protein